jgi:hypothetical protein
MVTENQPTPPPTPPVPPSNLKPLGNTPNSTTSPKLDLFANTKPQPPNRTLYRPIAQFVEELVNYDKQIVDPETGYAMTLEQVTVDMPIELKVAVNPDGTVKLTGSPPTQLVRTTIMPVFHHMRLRVVREDGE